MSSEEEQLQEVLAQIAQQEKENAALEEEVAILKAKNARRDKLIAQFEDVKKALADGDELAAVRWQKAVRDEMLRG